MPRSDPGHRGSVVKRVLGREHNLAKKSDVVAELENESVRVTYAKIGISTSHSKRKLRTRALDSLYDLKDRKHFRLWATPGAAIELVRN